MDIRIVLQDSFVTDWLHVSAIVQEAASLLQYPDALERGPNGNVRHPLPDDGDQVEAYLVIQE